MFQFFVNDEGLGVNGLSPDEDLANVSTDPSSDEDEPPEVCF